MNNCPSDVAAELDVSRETLERLEIYIDLLRRWNPKINLVSPRTLDQAWHRHVLDSAQIYGLAGQGGGLWADFGSGGGFPGLVAAILTEADGRWRVVLVESDQRKAAFLRAVSRECGIRANVLPNRIESTARIDADIISARALAPLDTLLGFCELHMAARGAALFPKGARADEEVAVAREKWSFTCEATPSVTDDAAVILKIGDIQRV